MKVTLDTNILVSATFWTGNSFRVLDLIDHKKIVCVLSRPIIAEYHKVLQSKEIIEKTDNKNLLTTKIAKKIIRDSQVVEPHEKISVVKEDPDDNKVLECAKEGKVDYIISQDHHLLKLKEFENIPILKPETFLRKVYAKHTDK